MIPQEASDAMVRRVQLMAEFIRTNHPGEFRNYWRDHRKGKAAADETLDFFARPDLADVVTLHRKVIL